ncbi:hypothetical protein B0H16DRAFT_421597 [Mycena metata]|uniref:F-box domain-containing protein n=1 Tax=Mycena metata TaxID=1033252 RepID=A0AAD7HF32_9AGAR|nr:hypothetical protein B0H16DRAFT_421597 [Mycena metata]
MSFATHRTQSREQVLIDDVVLLILEFCDIVSILAMGESSKYLRQLACSKGVWLAAVSELVRRGIVHRMEGEVLHELSKDQLVEKVKRAVWGPQTWGREYRGPPIISREITLPADHDGLYHFKLTLLPGGQYLFHLRTRGSQLDCWSIFERKIIWTHKGGMPSTTIMTFDAQLTTTSDHAVIMSCQRTQRGDLYENFVEVLTLDLRSGVAQSRMVARAPDGLGRGHAGPYAHPQISGDFAAVVVVTDIVLINWREEVFATIHIHSPSRLFMNFCRLVLTPEHAILLLLGPDKSESLVVCSLAALPWTLVDGFTIPSGSAASASALPKIRIERLPPSEADTQTLGSIAMSAYESPTQVGLFRVWIHVNRQSLSRSHSYNLDLRSRHPTLELRSTTYLGQSTVQMCGSPFSGHTVQWKAPSSFYLMPPGLHLDGGDSIDRLLEMTERQTSFFQISPYGGALVYGTHDSLVVQYYQ